MKRLLLMILCFATVFTGCVQAVHLPYETVDTEAVSAPETTLIEQPTATPIMTTAPIPTTAPEPTRVTVMAAGDLMSLYAQLNAARKGGKYQFDYCFADIREYVSAADLAIGNLETLIAEGHPYTGPSKGDPNPKLNAPEAYLSAVVECGFDVLINANNHIADRGTDGINKTIQKIKEYGVYHTGAYATGEGRTPLIVNVKGINIGILGYLDHLNGNPGKYEEGAINMYTDELVAADIAAAKESGADFIIVYMHWGTENTTVLTSAQKEQAMFVANAGANIIIGSHPHCPQGTQNIETQHGTVPVFYSLGNLISSMSRDINNDGVLVNIVLEKDFLSGKTSIAALTYTPILCTTTNAGRFVILPADLESIAQSGKARALKASRDRTVKVMGDTVAQPE